MKQEVTLQTLEATPERVTKFLSGIAKNASIRRILCRVGYSDAKQDRGWELYHAAAALKKSSRVTPEDRRAREAIATLDATDESLLRRAHAALSHHHPEQDQLVFDRLEPGVGIQAVITVATFLDRLDLLESSSNSEDRAAIGTLAERGIDSAYRTELRALVEEAEGAVFVEDEETGPDEERLEALRELRAWYADWAETARAVIKQRSQLRQLGLAHRRSCAVAEEGTGVDTALSVDVAESFPADAALDPAADSSTDRVVDTNGETPAALNDNEGASAAPISQAS